MASNRNTLCAVAPRPTIGPGARIGRIVELQQGRPLVEVDGQRLPARVATGPGAVACRGEAVGRAVLIVFEGDDPALPVIVGLVEDRWPGLDDEVEIDGRRLCIEGREEVVLRCGEASITLRADGQVVVKGARLTSRATETNKIRGATVLIN